MNEYLISLENRFQEIIEGKRETLEGMTFLDIAGREGIIILCLDKNNKTVKYRRISGDGKTDSYIQTRPINELNGYYNREVIKN